MATVLVLGSGGREHAMAHKLAESWKVSKVLVAPGNGGTTGGKMSNVDLKVDQPTYEGVAQFCKEQNVSLVAVGPEQPLVDGIADSLRAKGIRVFGCSKACAQIEGSKAFSKAFFSKYNIPTAQYKSFKGAGEADAAQHYVKTCGFPVVVKASGLCAGKGVVMPANQEEALAAVREMLLEKKFGDAGSEIVIEELMEGPECSVFGLCDGENVVPMVPAQDHKRARDNDEGPNTGGMGAYAPAPACTPQLQKRILEEILKPTMDGFQREGMPYQGLLYAGVMLTKDGPRLLEYNCRFGDPETQVVLPLLQNDLFDVMNACAVKGGLASCSVKFHSKSAVTVVMASDGYPESYKKGFPISGLPETAQFCDTIVFHAGTKKQGSDIVTSGGRVLAVSAVRDTLKDAISSAYNTVRAINWDNVFYRKDIAAKACVMAVTGVSRPLLSGNRSLLEVDPEIHELIDRERDRQICGIELIASENFTSGAVMQALGSCLTNKYSEGQAGNRYYGGNEVIDEIENICKRRALKAFGLSESQWGVNVQPYSGSPANFAVYTGLLEPHSRIMGLDLPSGGHLTHGYYTAKKKISATSIFFESLPYKVHPETGLIDFDQLRKQALLFRPAMIICGASAYPREIDFTRFKEIADECGALLMADMAHFSGLVAAGLHMSPFDYCDVVTSTTHKSLRGPRAGMIFYKYSDKNPDVKERIDMAVFPALQGGPHNHQIGALAVQLKEVATPEFKDYSQQVIRNSKALAKRLMEKGHKLATNGTDNHLVLLDVRPHGLTGSKVEKVCELAAISVNRNAVHGDVSALSPGGVRIGTPAMTTRGCTEKDFATIADFIDRSIQICLQVQKQKGKKLKDFQNGLEENSEIQAMKHEVEKWASKFGYPEPVEHGQHGESPKQVFNFKLHSDHNDTMQYSGSSDTMQYSGSSDTMQNSGSSKCLTSTATGASIVALAKKELQANLCNPRKFVLLTILSVLVGGAWRRFR